MFIVYLFRSFFLYFLQYGCLSFFSYLCMSFLRFFFSSLVSCFVIRICLSFLRSFFRSSALVLRYVVVSFVMSLYL